MLINTKTSAEPSVFTC